MKNIPTTKQRRALKQRRAGRHKPMETIPKKRAAKKAKPKKKPGK
jgi:hypothetical protein